MKEPEGPQGEISPSQPSHEINEALAVLSAVSRAIASSRTPEELAEWLADQLRKVLPADAFFVDAYDADRNETYGLANFDTIDGEFQRVPGAGVSLLREGHPARTVIEDQTPLLLHRSDDEPAFEALTPFGDTSRQSACLMYVPLVVATRVIGVLSIQSYKPNAYGPKELELLSAIGQQVAPAVEGVMLSRRLAESEEQFRAVFENAEDGVFIKDRALRYTQVNPAMERLIGLPAAEFIGKTDGDLFAPRIADHTKEIDLHVLAGETVEEENTRRIEGAARTFHVITAPMRDDSGAVVGVCGIVREITERKRAEEQVRHLNWVLRAVRNVNQLIARENDRGRLLQGACDCLVETRGYHSAWIALIDEEGGFGETYEAGIGESFASLREMLWRGEMTQCVTEALDGPGIVVIQDVSSACGECPLVEVRAGEAALTTRLEHGERLYGLLSASTPLVVLGDEKEQALFAELAGDIALALHAMEAEAKRQRAEERQAALTAGLRAVIVAADELIASPDVDTVYRRAVELARERLGLERCSIFVQDGESVRGTYGTDRQGHTANERAHTRPKDDFWERTFRLRRPGEPQWEVTESELYEWREGAFVFIGRGAVATTPIQTADAVIGTFCNDNAISGAPLDMVRQEAVAVYCSLLANIIQRKRAEGKLRFLGSVTEQVSDAIIVTDPDFRITYINAAAEHLYGYSQAELAGESPEVLNAEPMSEQIQEDIYETVSSGRVWTGSYLNRRRDGSTFLCELRISSLRDNQGRIYSHIATQRDVTERRRVEEALRLERDLSLGLLTAPSLDEALELCLESAIALSGLDAGGVYLVDSVSGDLDLACAKGLSSAFVEAQSHVAAGSDQARLVSAGKPVYVRAQDMEVSARQELVDEGIRALAVIPVVWQDRVIACLNIASHAFDDVQVASRDALEAASGLVGNAIARFRAEEALRQSEEKFRSVFEQTYDGIILIDEEGTIVEWNRAAEGITGRRRDEVIGQPAWDVQMEAFPEETRSQERRDQAKGSLQTFLKTGEMPFADKLQEIRAQRADGTRRVLQQMAFRVEAGERFLFGTVLRDITDRKRAEESQRLAAVGQLSAGVAHEFNNILAIMSGRAELAELEKTAGAYGELAAAVLRGTARGAEICRRLTSFARPQEPRRELMLVEDAIEAALAMAAREIENAGIRVERNYDTNGKRVSGDAGQLEQVFLNLIINACHAMVQGGALGISTAYGPEEGSGGKIVVTISDTGVGIRAEDLPHIFEPFFTSKGPLGDSDLPGTGLGLSVSHGIVRAHGGTVSVHSELGVGARFELGFQAFEDSAKEATLEEQGGADAATVDKGGVRVLVAEDEKDMREVAAAILSAEGYQVMGVASADEAVEAMSGTEFGVIVSDVMMPGGGAGRILTAARELPDPPPVVIITGRSEEDMIGELIREGAAVCLRKPFHLHELLEAVRGVLGEDGGLG